VSDAPRHVLDHLGVPVRDIGESRRFYEAALEPRLSLALLRKNSRIFQDLPVVEIAAAIFTEHGVRWEQRLHRRYAARTYCVQYQESDFAFVTRLFAEEGVPVALASGLESPQLDAGAFHVAPNARAETIGAQVAQSVYGGLKN